MKKTQTTLLALCIFASATMIAQSEVLCENPSFKVTKMDAGKYFTLVINDNRHVETSLDIFGLRYGMSGSVTPVFCNDSIVSFICKNERNTFCYWVTFKYFEVASDVDYPNIMVRYLIKNASPDAYRFGVDTIKAKEFYTNNKHWKCINQDIIKDDSWWEYTGIGYKTDAAGKKSIPDKVMSAELMDPFTMKRVIRRRELVEQYRISPVIEKDFEVISVLDMEHYGSKVISEKQIK